MSKWRDPAILARAPALRTGRNKGVRAAVREAKRADAGLRDADTLPERRSRRPAGGDEPPAGAAQAEAQPRPG